MTKSEFIDQLSARADMTKAEATKAVDVVLETIQDGLSRGEEIAFSGFGKFHVVTRTAREGVHPRSGERIHIEASKSPKFSAGSVLKKSVNR